MLSTTVLLVVTLLNPQNVQFQERVESWSAVHSSTVPVDLKKLLDTRQYDKAKSLAEQNGWYAEVVDRQLVLFDLKSTGVLALELKATVFGQIADMYESKKTGSVLNASDLPDKGAALIQFMRAYYPNPGALLTPDNAVFEIGSLLVVNYEVQGKPGRMSLNKLKIGGGPRTPAINADRPRTEFMDVTPAPGYKLMPTGAPLQFEFSNLLNSPRRALMRSVALKVVAKRIEDAASKSANAGNRLRSLDSLSFLKQIEELNASGSASLADIPGQYRQSLNDRLEQFLKSNGLDELDREEARLTSVLSHAEIQLTIEFTVLWPDKEYQEGFKVGIRIS